MTPSQPGGSSSTITTTVPESSNPATGSATSTVTLPATVSRTITSDAVSAIRVTTTNSRGQTVTTVPATLTSEVVTSDANGVVYTVTQIVKNPTGSLNDGSGSSGGGSTFFNNTGAVVGVFVVVGIAGAAILLGACFLFFRRRRRQKLDRDVAAAAAAANAAAQRTPFDDDEDASGGHTSYTSTSGPAMTQYGGYYATGPGSYDYESAGGYDPYAAAASGAAGAALGAGAATAAQNNRHSLVSNAGIAGLGGNERFATNHAEPSGPYANESQYYLDPQEYDYDKTPENERYMDEPHAHHGMGYAEPYLPHGAQQQSHQPHPQHSYGPDANGDLTDDEVDYNGRRGLRVRILCSIPKARY